MDIVRDIVRTALIGYGAEEDTEYYNCAADQWLKDEKRHLSPLTAPYRRFGASYDKCIIEVPKTQISGKYEARKAY